MVLDRFELLDELGNLILRNRLEIPLTGTTVCFIRSTHIISFSPEAQFLILVRVNTMVVIQLVYIIAVMSGPACQADIEEISVSFGEIINLNFVISSVVKYYMANLCCISSKLQAVRAIDADSVLHTNILHQNAIANLCKLPYIVSSVSSERTPHTHIRMINIEGSKHTLIYVCTQKGIRFTCFGILGICIVTHASKNTVVTILRNLVGYLRIQDNLPHRVDGSPRSISLVQRDSIRI